MNDRKSANRAAVRRPSSAEDKSLGFNLKSTENNRSHFHWCCTRIPCYRVIFNRQYMNISWHYIFLLAFFFIYISSWYSLKGLFFCFLLLFLLFLPRHWYTRMNPTLDIVRFVNAVVLSHTQIVFFVYENRIGICVLKHKVFFCVQNSSF